MNPCPTTAPTTARSGVSNELPKRSAVASVWISLSVLDPRLLVDDLGAELFELRDLIPDDQLALRRARSINFDGCASLHPETKQPLIIMNCGRPIRRRTATLMEELAHLLLKHEPTRIEIDPRLGIVRRSYNREQEHEAYDRAQRSSYPSSGFSATSKTSNSGSTKSPKPMSAARNSLRSGCADYASGTATSATRAPLPRSPVARGAYAESRLEVGTPRLFLGRRRGPGRRHRESSPP